MKSRVSARKIAVLTAGIAAAAIAVPLSVGSSHREAPNIALDPTADNTDVYAFTAADAPDALTIVSNWIPGQVPANGPNFFRFDDRARYYVNIDNKGDGKPNARYQFRFKTSLNNPDSFLYAGPGTAGFGDPGLNVEQRYRVTHQSLNKNGKVTDSKTLAKNLPVAPSNIGPKTFPSYENFVGAATKTLSDGSRVFVGQREDPFFVDLGAVFDAINLRSGTGNVGGGKDDLSGYSVSSIVLQIPEEKVTKNGKPVSGEGAKNAVVGVWSSTERRKLEVTKSDFDSGAKGKIGKRGKNGSKASNPWVQVSRLGNPLINELVIPLGMKDKFNRTTPDNDAANFGEFATNPELAAILNALFGVGAPETDRADVVQALLQGLPGLNEHSGKNAQHRLTRSRSTSGLRPPRHRAASASSVAIRPGSRTVAAWQTMSLTSSSRSWPGSWSATRFPSATASM